MAWSAHARHGAPCAAHDSSAAMDLRRVGTCYCPTRRHYPDIRNDSARSVVVEAGQIARLLADAIVHIRLACHEASRAWLSAVAQAARTARTRPPSQRDPTRPAQP